MTCAKCHRQLRDPASVRRGFGPVCWALAQAKHGRDPAADSDYGYRIDVQVGHSVLVIIDADRGGKSITNNMEAVLAKIGRDEDHKLKVDAIIYRDSDGNFDGVRYNGSRADFYPLIIGRRVTSETEALQAVRGQTIPAP